MEFTNKYCFFLLFVLGATASVAMARTLEDASMHEKHEQWMARYGRVYKDATEELSYNILEQNVARIEAFNKDSCKPCKLGVNKFADLTNEEFKATRNRFKGHMCSAQVGPFRCENATAIPSSMDCRRKGAVTPIKDQGQCGACWPFSAVDGRCDWVAKRLDDCDKKSEDEGCEGGLMDDALKFIQQNQGITTESNYPCKAADGTCNTKEESNHAAKTNGYEDVPANSEAALMKAVANQPIPVAFDAGGFEFQFYSSGIFTGDCGTGLDHGVAAVAYGVSDGMKYWLVKNSWGTEWGEEGYIPMQNDRSAKEGPSGIAMQASYPTA